jgi:uncharacterized protein
MNHQKFLEGIRLFNEGKYFECHDLFEEIWMQEEGSDAEFFRALIHLAVGCYHMKNDNFRGAKSQLMKGIKKREPYESQHFGISISHLIEVFKKVIIDVERVVQGRIEVEEVCEIPVIGIHSET